MLETETTEDQKLVQKYMTDIVATFAATGDPLVIEEFGGIWEPLQAGMNFMNMIQTKKLRIIFHTLTQIIV